ncbi:MULTISPECIES: helix-hairpin-helix domain-containing protein [Capnocytophaga]|uniref:helix-hairpin-helix domain-containing protein n=1 Tax=Capnocytophaga TaxID=1016 RepID=UPI000BB173E2|nr:MULTISPECIES: helix-hairpin-helix domain-containing protein [unclassified Capnocytophaga]ATA72044.1 DNA-binding protein [Capnocytophaga sp. H4358]ATA74162.1 DNA-binding protein [Capnocytophaga sp. H2931]
MKGFPFFKRNQRIGIFLLLLLIVLIQIAYFVVDFSEKTSERSSQLFANIEKQVDSLRTVALRPKKDTIYPFNPNYITDYKGYILGMSTEEIDRLLAFRKQGKFVNSTQEFQNITKISDSLLKKIAPAFKFPEWVNNKKSNDYQKVKTSLTSSHKEKQDINTATKEQLMEVKGVGNVLSDRILKYKERLQGFVEMDQLAEVYGLETDVVERLKIQFEVKTLPNIVKKDINLITLRELAKIPYLKYEETKKIIGLRSELGNFKKFDDLLEINEFDTLKIRKLQFYLFIEN